MENSSHLPHDRPLSPAAKAGLVLSASAVILFCYFCYAAAIVLLALLLACESVLVLAAARFGLAGFMASLVKRHLPLLGILFRSFWLNKGTDYRIPLQPAEAPKLFALLENLCVRLKIAPPQEVSIEMNAGAWVLLPGYRRGAGRTVLGIGYDLLAALSAAEVEAVMAHEMTHAKLVRRGLKHWLNAGLARTVRVASRLAELVEAYRRAKIDFALATGFLRAANALAGLAARLVAKYSRQDEFEADRGAAELCGAEPLRASLTRLEALQEKISRLPWPERVARMELDESFSQWLVTELKLPASAAEGTQAPEARDPFSTHPSLRDRIAALPTGIAARRDEASAITLLAEPDRIAGRLVTEIQRVLAEQEQKDTQSLARWARKTQRSRTTEIRWQQFPAVCLILGGIFCVGMALVDQGGWIAVALAVVLIGGGIWLWRMAAYKDRWPLPVPTFAALKQAWQADRPPDLGEKEKALAEELSRQAATVSKKSGQIALLLGAGYDALACCDYLRAHVAMRLVLDRDDKSVAAAIGMAVAAGGLNLEGQMGGMLEFVRGRTGLATPATIWGAAWALTLIGDWDRAEALLWRKHEKQPEETTFLLLLALTQLRRNKLQSAALNAGKAVALTPTDIEAVKLLCDILITSGRLRDAEKYLAPLETQAATDPELALLMVRLHLLQRKLDPARHWAATLQTPAHSAHWLVRLGGVFEMARIDEEAERWFNDALVTGFYPEAHLGLARLAAGKRDHALARGQILAALNLEKTVGPKGAGPLPLFGTIIGQLMMLEEPREGCRAWIVTFPAAGPTSGTPTALAKCSLMVYAPDQSTAQGYLTHVVAAMQPATPPPLGSTLHWQSAPQDQQPIRPVRPGVQFVL